MCDFLYVVAKTRTFFVICGENEIDNISLACILNVSIFLDFWRPYHLTTGIIEKSTIRRFSLVPKYVFHMVYHVR